MGGYFLPTIRWRLQATHCSIMVEWFTYTGVEIIPDDVTHVGVAIKTIPAYAFAYHDNIVEVCCHGMVEKIERYAFYQCPSLRQVYMPGVAVVEEGAFSECEELEDVGCFELERIGKEAFSECKSLPSINLPSIKVVEEDAFEECENLIDVIFGSKLERIEKLVFNNCTSLERIAIPLKDGIITRDNIFRGCENLNHVDLVDRALLTYDDIFDIDLSRVDLVEGALHETIAALQLEEWRKDMREEIDSINQILPNLYAGGWDDDLNVFPGDKAGAIRRWIRSVLGKVIHYKAEHGSVLDYAATTLQLALPRDIVMNNVLPFLALPPHTFEGERGEGGADEMM